MKRLFESTVEHNVSHLHAQEEKKRTNHLCNIQPLKGIKDNSNSMGYMFPSRNF